MGEVFATKHIVAVSAGDGIIGTMWCLAHRTPDYILGTEHCPALSAFCRMGRTDCVLTDRADGGVSWTVTVITILAFHFVVSTECLTALHTRLCMRWTIFLTTDRTPAQMTFTRPSITRGTAFDVIIAKSLIALFTRCRV